MNLGYRGKRRVLPLYPRCVFLKNENLGYGYGVSVENVGFGPYTQDLFFLKNENLGYGYGISVGNVGF